MAKRTLRYPGLLIAGAVILFFAALFAMDSLNDHIGRKSQLFVVAREVAQKSPAVCAKVGCPAMVGWPVKIEIAENLNGESGRGAIDVPISGRRGKAGLIVEGIKSDGTWTITHVSLRMDGTSELLTVPFP